MEIYVRSRGKYEDYRWLKITKNNQQRDEHRIIGKFIGLIQSEAFSVVLARLGKELLLLITGLESSSRKDFGSRPIRNSVAWVGENSDESAFRAMAVRALRDSLRDALGDEIDRAVTFGGEEGFMVSFSELPELVSAGKAENLPQNLTINKIGRTSDNLKNDLADELDIYRLPEKEGALVVVTEVKKREAFEKAGVWRGLSSLVEAEGWENVPESGALTPLSSLNPQQANTFLKNPKLLLQFLSIGVLVVLTMMSLLRGIWEQPRAGVNEPVIIEFSSKVAVGEEIKFRGNYNPDEIDSVSIVSVADKEYSLAGVADEETVAILKPEEGTWQYDYNGFSSAKLRNIKVIEKNRDGVVRVHNIHIDVVEKKIVSALNP